MQKDIIIEWFYRHPVETLWDCLTKPELLRQWSLNSGDFKAEVGYKWMEQKSPKRAMNWDGKMYFEVLEVVPLKKISYKFQGGPREGVITLDTVVTWILIPKEGGTLLRLEHTGFKPNQFLTRFAMNMGWRGNVAKRLERTLQTFSYDTK